MTWPRSDLPGIPTGKTARALLSHLKRQAIHLSVTPDGALRVWPAAALDSSLRDAITRHKSELIALLGTAENDEFADDRRRCRDCYHLQLKGNCAMAAQGHIPGTERWYMPDKHVLQRCHLFCALPY